MSLTIDQIRTDGGTQSRAAINEATVAEYAEAMTDENTVFPPVTVYFDGREYWLADGFHRLAAWARIGRTEIPAEVRQGDRRRAILHSVAANSAHGLRRTNDDKRRAVLTLLDDAEWSQWSDREIARRCAVSHEFVRGQRGSLSTNDSENRAFTTRHGTQATMNTAKIGVASKPDQKGPGEKCYEKQKDISQDPPKEAEKGPSDQEPEPAPEAKARRELAKLTPEALIDDVLGLRADLAETRAKLRDVTRERDALKARVKDFEGDQAEVIRRQQKEIERLRSEIFRANEKARVSIASGRKAQDEVKAMRAKMEAQEIPL